MGNKYLKKSICISFLFLLIFHSLHAEDKEQMNHMDSLIYSGNYTIKITQIEPSSASTILANTIYTLIVKNDSVYSDLPYFGRAYHLNYNQIAGLEMETGISDYTIKRTRKGFVEASFKSRTKDDKYSWKLLFERNGSVFIRVSMKNKQPIGFSGRIVSL